MNPIFSEARTTVDGMWIMGMMTVVFLVFFTGWVIWAWWPGRREAMEEASMMPFDDDFSPETSPSDGDHGGRR